jgi:hypothetical protein
MSRQLQKNNAIIAPMLKLRVIMAQKAFNRIHESRRKLGFWKTEICNMHSFSSFPDGSYGGIQVVLSKASIKTVYIAGDQR